MRTKTLLLSGVVAALSSVSLMAQVYSLNAVGYINVTVPTGWSMIANQLNTGNNVITNLITVDPAGSMDGLTIFKYVNTGNPATSGYNAILTADSLNYPGVPWDGADATVTTLNPGEAAFVYNPPILAKSFTFTFVGTVLQGSLTNNLLTGWNLVSSLVPQAGNVFTNLGIFPGNVVDSTGNSDGDNVFIFDSGTYDQISDVDSLSPPSYLDGAQNPSVGVGQGFFYFRSSLNSATLQWIRSFNVN